MLNVNMMLIAMSMEIERR